MSTFLVHGKPGNSDHNQLLMFFPGFRWDREKIRDMTVFWNADDVSPNNLMTPSSQTAMIHELKKRFPTILKKLPNLRLIEPANQYKEVSRWAGAPVVFVCDVVIYTESYLLLDLSQHSIDVKQWDGMQDLLEQLSPKESLQWFVVANNNEEIMPRERARFGLPPPDAERTVCAASKP